MGTFYGSTLLYAIFEVIHYKLDSHQPLNGRHCIVQNNVTISAFVSTMRILHNTTLALPCHSTQGCLGDIMTISHQIVVCYMPYENAVQQWLHVHSGTMYAFMLSLMHCCVAYLFYGTEFPEMVSIYR